MQIGLSYDHNGYEIGQKVKEYLTNKGYKVIDYNNKYDKEDDYPKEALKTFYDTLINLLEDAVSDEKTVNTIQTDAEEYEDNEI